MHYGLNFIVTNETVKNVEEKLTPQVNNVATTRLTTVPGDLDLNFFVLYP
jgi:hypothetical protein